MYGSGTTELVMELGNSAAVKKNSEIKALYEKFKNEYEKVTSGNAESLDKNLSLWRARHNFVLAIEDITYASSDAEITAAAKNLIDSGNDTLKAYGEGWLEKTLAVSAAYRTYRDTSRSNPDYNSVRNNYDNLVKERSDYIATNKPDLSSIAPLKFDDTSILYQNYSDLHSLISDTYEKNYNYDSGDCREFSSGEVICD